MKTHLILSIGSFVSAVLPFILGAIFCHTGNEKAEVFSLLCALVTFPLSGFLMNASLDSQEKRKIYDNKKVGGIRFIRLGRFSFSYSISQGKKLREVDYIIGKNTREIPYVAATGDLARG